MSYAFLPNFITSLVYHNVIYLFIYFAGECVCVGGEGEAEGCRVTVLVSTCHISLDYYSYYENSLSIPVSVAPV